MGFAQGHRIAIQTLPQRAEPDVDPTHRLSDRHTKQILFLAIALDAAEECLTLPDRIQRGVSHTVLILLLIQIGLWAARTVRFYLEMKELSAAPTGFCPDRSTSSISSRHADLVAADPDGVDNVGVNITALLAGLGVGGVAVALALQNVLAICSRRCRSPSISHSWSATI